MVPFRPPIISTMVNDYAARLRHAMGEAGISVTALARKVDLTYQAVKKVLDGKSGSFSAHNNARVAALLKVSSDWLASGTGQMRQEREVQSQTRLVAREPRIGEPAFQSLEDALQRLGIELARDMPDDVRDDVADALHKMAKRRGAARDQEQVLALLADPPRKRRADAA